MMGHMPAEDAAQPTEPVTVDTESTQDAAPVQARENTEQDAKPAFTLPVLTTNPVEDGEPADTFIDGPLKGDNWDFALPNEETQKSIQESLRELDLYPGKLNGKWGPFSVAAIQQSVSVEGTREPSFELCKAILEETGEDVGDKAILSQDVWELYAQALKDRK